MPRLLRWKIADLFPVREQLATVLGVDPIVGQVLLARGYETPDQARQFLEAPLDKLTDPDFIVDLSRAADRIVQALRSHEPITIYGDYDADGVTATSLLVRGLSNLGGRVTYYIPSRSREGYGVNEAALEAISRRGGGLVVTVDCGVTAAEEVAQAGRRGQEIIIVDHHEPPRRLPMAVAVVDPKRTDHASPFREYCAAGLAFQLLRGVRRRLQVPEMPEQWLDMAALGTVADVVPLIGDNRILARAGLARMPSTATVGLVALMRVIGLEGDVSVRHVGFSLAPRLNAAGRLGDATVAVRLLTTDDPAEAEAIARQLDEENTRRQAVCDQIEGEAVERIETERLFDAPAIVLADARWHPGVIGIVASRLVERYYRPTVLLAVENGVGKGSARSIAGFHLVDALNSCAELLTRAGGHAMAAGLTIAAERIPEFARRFVAVAGERLSPEQLVPALAIDAVVSLDALTETLARQLARLAPFGAGNREPVLAVRGLRAVSTRVLGDGLHLRLGVTDGQGFAEAIGFRLGDASDLLAFTQAHVDLAFTLVVDRWEERERVQLVLRDLQTPGVDLDTVLADSQLLIDRLFTRAQDYLGERVLGIEEAGAFYTKVVGVSFEGRQGLVRALAAGDPLLLRREPGNPHDPHAIKVMTQSGEQIGYLSARLAARLAPSIDAGARYSAIISQITGGGERNFGVNVYLQRQERAADGFEARTLLRLAWKDLPSDALLDRLRVHLHRGRQFRAPQAEAIQAILGGRSVHGIFGPGRGRRGVIEAAAAGAAIASRTPVVIAVPLRSQVDQWHVRLAPRLEQLGVQCLHAHGALFFRQRQRLLEALRRAQVDVIVASVEYLRHHHIELRPALLLVESEPTIDASTLDVLAERLGHPQVAIFEAGVDRTDPSTLLGWGTQELIVDPHLRMNLRLVDRRESANREAVLQDVVERGDKTLIHVASAVAAVELASQLKQTGRAVAYYHDGLPLRVREVLEQMFADGKIGVLVAAGCTEEVAASDLRQVVVAGLPTSRAELVDQIGVAGLDGRQSVVTLLYRRVDLDVVKAVQAERNPSREVLAALYRGVRSQAERGQGVLWPDQGLVAALKDTVPAPRTIGIGLDILAEAGVLQREFDGERWRITLAPEVGKRELSTSLRYAEGQREAEAVAALAQWAFGPLPEMLRAVAGPAAGTTATRPSGVPS